MKTANSEKQDIGALRRQKIASRIEEIPKKYRKIYKKAVESNSKAAAVKALCLECVCWQKNEIINCPCLACPLYGVRPFTESRQPAKNDGFCGQTSTQTEQAVSKQGRKEIDVVLAAKP
jgi:hypothetical protein